MPPTLKAISLLSRPRLSMLVAFSALAGYLLTGLFSFPGGVALGAGVFLLSSGSSALNQFQERNLDARMPRTQKRPIPSGKITPRFALTASILLLATGSSVLFLLSPLAMMLGWLNILLYNGIYTPMKTRSAFSIIPGALVGAIPPLMGWSAAGASLTHPHILFVASFMFLWQIPHFWLLLTIYGEEYEKAGYHTLSRYFSRKGIKSIVFLWALLTSLFLFLFPVFQLQLPTFLAGFLIAGNTLFILLFYNFLFKKPEKLTAAFVTINTFMTVMLVLFVAARFLN